MFSNSSLRVRVGSAVILVAVMFVMMGCGGSGSSNGPSLGPGTNNSMLHGQYAFSFAGQNGTTGTMMAVGSFTADGNGNITGGMEDFNAGNRGLSFTFTGKYSVGSDLRGTAILNGLQVCPNWQFVMLNTSHALMTCFDTANTASGSIDVQDTTAFSNAKLTGDYVFGISGLGIGGSVAVSAGDWTMDGQGGITGGEWDVNDSLSTVQDSPLTGTYNVASNGRGTLSFTSNAYGTQSFAFYVVNSTDLKILETDAFSTTTPVLSGEVLRQAPGPFTLASFNGGHVFTLGGVDSSGLASGTGGVFTADGNGGLSGVLDDNDAGNASFGLAFTGTYSMGANGRALLGFSFLQLAAYPAANGTMELVELDGNGISAGLAKIQSGSFSNGSVTGNFALNWTGTLNPNGFSNPSEEDIVGQLSADGNGTLAGTLDVNSFGNNIIQGLPVAGSTYTMTGDGRGTASVNTSAASFNMQTYQADPNTVLFLDIDTTRVLVGLMQKQQ
jgi:hypothetical protein